MFSAVSRLARRAGRIVKTAATVVKKAVQWLATPEGQLAVGTVVVAVSAYNELAGQLAGQLSQAVIAIIKEM